MAEEGPTAAQKQLSAESRAYCFGQDTSQLYACDDGKKAWRAEVPATDEEKQQAAAAEAEFRKEFSLGGLALRDVYDRHVEALTNLLKEGAAQHRAWYERRLARAHDAWANLKSIPEICSAEHAFPEGLCDFVTYVHGKPHGTREVLKVPKPRGEPYEPGRVRGARTPPCSCPALSHVCSALSHSQVLASPASRTPSTCYCCMCLAFLCVCCESVSTHDWWCDPGESSYVSDIYVLLLGTASVAQR